MLDVLESPALVLSQDLREKYFRDGYLGVSGLVSDEWLSRLRQVTAEYVDISRSLDSRGCDAHFHRHPSMIRRVSLWRSDHLFLCQILASLSS